jgi:hypothetical protein
VPTLVTAVTTIFHQKAHLYAMFVGVTLTPFPSALALIRGEIKRIKDLHSSA